MLLNDYLSLLSKWDMLGISEKTDDMCIAFGANWPDYDYRYFHCVFHPLPDHQIQEYLTKYAFFRGWRYIVELKYFNGAILYDNKMEMFGLLPNYGGSVGFVAFQLDIENGHAIVNGQLPRLIIGSLNVEGVQKWLVETRDSGFEIRDRETNDLETQFVTFHDLMHHCIQLQDREYLGRFKNANTDSRI